MTADARKLHAGAFGCLLRQNPGVASAFFSWPPPPAPVEWSGPAACLPVIGRRRGVGAGSFISEQARPPLLPCPTGSSPACGGDPSPAEPGAEADQQVRRRS